MPIVHGYDARFNKEFPMKCACWPACRKEPIEVIREHGAVLLSPGLQPYGKTSS